MAIDFDNTITIAGPTEDLKAIYEELIDEYGSDHVEYSGDRITCRGNSKSKPAFDLSQDLSKKYPRVTVGHFFWAEYGECHGYAIFVVGTTEYEEFQEGIPCHEDDEVGGDAAARLIQERYKAQIESFLSRAAN